MFNNLIESTSHAKEFKRRGSFVLLTTVTYGVLLVIGGIASVYAYDAHLDSQGTQLEITFMPILPEAPQPQPPRSIARPAPNSGGRTPTESTRTVLMDSTSNPNNPPKIVGTIAPDVPPALPPSRIGRFNADPEGPAFSTNRGPRGTGSTPAVEIDTPPPPPAATPKPEIPKVLKVSQGVLTSKVLNLPRPNYPPLAKQIHLQGSVSIQVLIDEHGKVVSAKALSGHQVLVNAAEAAALQARFSPTLLSGQPVKVSGVIIYNFVLP
jgi:TonB family protein